jgi:hypothetical protein
MVLRMRAFVVGAVMLMSLSGIACSSTGNEQGSSSQASNEEAEESAASDNTKAQNTQQQSKSNAPSQQNLSIGDAATFANGSSVTLYSYTSPVQSDNPLKQPQAGNQFAVIDVEGCADNTEVTNESGEAQEFVFNPFFFTLEMPDGTRLQRTISVVEPALSAVNIRAGDCVRGSVTFEVPQGVTPRYVVRAIPYQTVPDEQPKWAMQAKWAIE